MGGAHYTITEIWDPKDEGTYKQYKNVRWKRYSFWAMPFLRFEVLAIAFYTSYLKDYFQY